MRPGGFGNRDDVSIGEADRPSQGRLGVDREAIRLAVLQNFGEECIAAKVPGTFGRLGTFGRAERQLAPFPAVRMSDYLFTHPRIRPDRPVGSRAITSSCNEPITHVTFSSSSFSTTAHLFSSLNDGS